MGKAEREKGKRGELELSHKLNQLLSCHGIDGIKVQRSQQFCGKSGDADLRGLPGFYIECKRVESLNVHKAYSTACADNKSSSFPVVMFRRNAGKWMACLSLEDFMTMYCAVNRVSQDPDCVEQGFWQQLADQQQGRRLLG